MMKKVSLEKKPCKVIHKHKTVYFQDVSHNKKVAVKVCLPSASLDGNFAIALKMKGNLQYLCTSNKVNHFFLSKYHSRNNWTSVEYVRLGVGELQA